MLTSSHVAVWYTKVMQNVLVFQDNVQSLKLSLLAQGQFKKGIVMFEWFKNLWYCNEISNYLYENWNSEWV